MTNVPTPHISANIDEFAKTVIMPGDPLRAKFIAENYLENVTEISSVRNMIAYTGTYKGKEVSVMGSGMGMPSIGIYAYELYKYYGVENIIRIGSAGGFCDSLNIEDVILVTGSHTVSNYGKIAFDIDEPTIYPDNLLTEKLYVSAYNLKYDIVNGKVETTDVFYRQDKQGYMNLLEKEGCIASEMEAYSLFATAKYLGKSAACLLTVSAHMSKNQTTTSKQREETFTKMIEVSLEASIMN